MVASSAMLVNILGSAAKQHVQCGDATEEVVGRGEESGGGKGKVKNATCSGGLNWDRL